MELNYDWRAFQSIFDPRRRAAIGRGDEAASPVQIVVDDSKIVSVYAEGEDYSEWIGSSVESMAEEVTHRELVLFQRSAVDQWLSEVASLPHFYEQVETLRQKASSQVVSRARKETPGLVLKDRSELAVNRHFLLEAIQGWWAKILPSSYGIYLRLQGERPGEGRDILVIVRRGRIDAFCEPDFAALGAKDRILQQIDIVKYLSDRYLVPVQGVFVPHTIWKRWGDAENPWKEVALAIREEEAQLVPFRWLPVALAATRGFLGF